MEATKVDDNTISVVKIVNTEIKYTLEYLIKQKQDIQDQKDRDNKQRDLELAEIDELLVECEKLGIK